MFSREGNEDLQRPKRSRVTLEKRTKDTKKLVSREENQRYQKVVWAKI